MKCIRRRLVDCFATSSRREISMANQEHLDLLRQGTDVWNSWREQHLEAHPDRQYAANLSSADLYAANLNGANLSNTSLYGAFLREADLTGANLSHSNLHNAILIAASLSDANLTGANLSGADFSSAILSNANLTGANLNGANFSGANLSGANLSNTFMGRTVFGNVDLRRVKGLETVVHSGPSTLGTDTIYFSQGNIPEAFLKGAGVDDTFITYIRSLVGYYSCFISYSSEDEAFARRLYADLQNNNVRCWFAPEDLKIGDRFADRIEESIRICDKLLVVLSEHSIRSTWVEDEFRAAMEKENRFKEEQQVNRTVLFPIKLDETIKE